MSKRIFLYSSELAAFIGRHSHTNSCKIFNKLYEKYFQDNLKKLKVIDKIEQKNITDDKNIELIAKKTESNKNFKEQLTKLCNSNLSSLGMQKERDELLKTVSKDKNLTEDEKILLKKATENFTSKTFGTIRESNAMDVYKKAMDCEVVTGIVSRNKKLISYDGYELWLISKIDGMKMDGTIVEIKNRMYKLFEEVREYEWLQVQAYMEVYNLDNSELVEYLKNGKDEMRVNQIARDRKFWEEIVMKDLQNYFYTFINLIMNEKKLIKYISLGETEQNEFIKKMVRKESKSK